MPKCYLKSLFILLLSILTGCQGELYNNSELFEESFGEASTPSGCQTDSTTGFSQGDGSAGAPYEICNKEQLINLAIKMNSAITYPSVATKHFKLTANIDMNGPEEVTYPIGYLAENILKDKLPPNARPFDGVFDGDGYYVDNIVMNLENQNYVGFFQHLGPFAEIKNLRLRGMISVADTSYYVGSVAGYSEGKIENVISYITLNLDTTIYSGGLVGYQKNNQINTSEYRGFVKVDDSGTHVGGIAGGAKSVQLTGVLNFSDVQGKDYVGGIFGSAETVTGDQLDSSKVVSGSGNYVGGIAGRLYSNSNLTTLTARSRVITTGNYAGSIVGVSENSTLTTVNAECLSSLSNVDCEIQAGNYAGAIAGACLGDNSFENITVNRSLISEGYGAALGCAYNEGVSITDSTLDGLVKASNHYIAGVAAYSIGEIDLSNVEVDAQLFGTNVGTQNYVGMLAGYTSGTVVVSASQFNGTIGDDPNDALTFEKCHDYAGGLIGENTKSVDVSSSDISLTVNCTGSYIGGLIGANSAEDGQSVQISSINFTGDVTGFYAVGGGVGSSVAGFSLLSSTINANVLSQTYYAGGVAGYVDASTGDFLVNQTQFDGSAEASSTAAGIVAYGVGAITITDSYIGSSSGVTITSENRSGGVAGDITSAYISDVHVSQLNMPNTSAEFMGGLVGVGIELQILRSSVSNSYINGFSYVAGIVASLSTSYVDMVKVRELVINATGDFVAGGIGVLRLSALRNLQLGSHNFSKSNMIDSITGQNMIAGGVAMIETTSVILNSTSTFNLNSAGSFGGFVAQDISIDSVSDNVFFDSDRAGTNLTANGLGINLLSSEMTDIIMYGAFDFGLWSSPTYNFSYPELQL